MKHSPDQHDGFVPQPAPSQTGTPIEQRLDRMQALFNAQVDRAEKAELALSQAKRDAERMDYLEREMELEQEYLRDCTREDRPLALFRRNVPITRAAVDAALAKREGEGKK